MQIVLFLIHNVILHPIAGLLWAIAQVFEHHGGLSVSDKLDKLGNQVHDFLWRFIDDDDT